MPDYDFPNNPSTGLTHAIAEKTWEFNGSAWEKTFSGDGIREIGITGAGSVSGSSGLQFDSGTSGLTLTVTKSGNTANVKFDYDALKSSSGRAKYTYTVVTGVLNIPNATSNGQFIYNDTTGALSIHKFDNAGGDFRTELSGIANNGTSSKINVIVGSEDRTKIFEVDSDHSTYSDPNLDVTSSFLQGSTGGSGKVVSIFVDQGEQRIRAKAFRFPDGTSAETIVTSFNGLTGDVTTNGLTLPVAGISSSGGITIGGDMHTPAAFHMRNPDGEAFLDVSNVNVQIGDADGVNNGTKILIRDSHNVITQTAATSISLNAPDVKINSKLSHNADTDTYIDFAAANNVVMLAGGNTFAHGTSTKVHLPLGISADGGSTLDYLDIQEHLNFRGSVSKNISHNGSNVLFLDAPNGVMRAIIYSFQTSREVSHSGDSDTFLRFPANDNLQLSAGGNIGLAMNATNTTIDGVTFDAGVMRALGMTLGPGGLTFSDGTNMRTAASGGGGGVTSSIGFIIDGNGSPITTGDKLDALKQVPSDCHIFKASAYVNDGISGSDKQIRVEFKRAPSLALFSSAIGTGGSTLEIGRTGGADQTGITFEGSVGFKKYFSELTGVSSSEGSTLNADEWIFPHVVGNSGDVTKLQVFLTVSPVA